MPSCYDTRKALPFSVVISATELISKIIPNGALLVHQSPIGKTKYMIMSRDQNAGQSYSMKIDNSSIERVEEFKYLGTILTNKNSIQEDIKSRLRLGNA